MSAAPPVADSSKPAPVRPRRRWYQFTLRGLTIFMVVSSLLLGIFGWRLQRARKQAAAVATIRAQRGGVSYDYAMRKDDQGMYDQVSGPAASPVPEILRKLLGDDFFHDVYDVHHAANVSMNQQELDAAWNAIGTFTHLRRLQISGGKVSHGSGIKSLEKTRELQHLLIDYGKTEPNELKVIGELTQLQELKLWGVEVDDEVLESLVNLDKLRVLEVSARPVTLRGTRAVSRLKNLEELRIFFCRFGDDEVVPFAKLSKLKRLTLGECKVGDRGVESIAKLQNLEWLDLPGAPVGDAGMDSLAKLPKLSYVNILRTKISNAGLRKLSRAKSITHLSVDQTAIDDDGLAALEGFSQLTDFSINWNPITDRGLAQARFPPTLRWLGLMNSKVSDDGMKHLTHLSALQMLDVQFSDVTGVGAAEVTKKVPGCKVLFTAPKTPPPPRSMPASGK